MGINRKQPCDNCPFRSDKPFYLREEKVKAILQGLQNDQHFCCHKTLDYSKGEQPEIVEGSSICIGSALFMEYAGIGALSNVCYRIAIMTGDLTLEDLQQDLPVYRSVEELIEARRTGR